MAFSVSLIQPDELPELLAFAEATFRAAWQASNDTADFEAYCSTAFTAEKLAAELAHPGSEFFFVRDGAPPVAYLKLNFDQAPPGLAGEKTVQIERIYVEAAYQGRRIGEQLLQLADERARHAGARWLWLSVWQEAPRSRAFYERNGFEVFGTEVFVVGSDPQLDWLMRRKV